MATTTINYDRIVFPGDELPTLPTPSKPRGTVKLGPGITPLPATSSVIPTRAGEAIVDEKKCAIYIESNNKRYVPHVNDSIIGIVLRSTADSFFLSIPNSSNQQSVVLPHLAFENATKKTKPNFVAGTVVYCRVSLANKFMDTEVECFNTETGKADGYGELKNGMLFPVSLGLARRLLGDGKKLRLLKNRQATAAGEKKIPMSSGLEALDELGLRVPFEIAVGRNGRVWINSADLKTTLLIGKTIQDCEFLTGQEQKELVRERVKSLQ